MSANAIGTARGSSRSDLWGDRGPAASHVVSPGELRTTGGNSYQVVKNLAAFAGVLLLGNQILLRSVLEAP